MNKTVYIGMTADIMHPGLIRIINEATKYGDYRFIDRQGYSRT